MKRLWSQIGVRALSVALLAAAGAGGVYLGQHNDADKPDMAAQLLVRADADELRLIKTRQNEHSVTRAWQREAENEAAAKAATQTKSSAHRAHTLEKAVVKKAEEKKAKESGALVPYAGPIPTSCKEYSGNKATGCALTLEAGFGIDQFPCLERLWTKESGWNARAENKGSGAYGIPQALPGSKMGSIAPDWRTNPATQIKWGLGYIKGRYKTPCGAWSNFQNNGNY